MSDKPKTVSEYKTWMTDNTDIRIDERIANHYQSVVNKCHTDICASDFWKKFCASLPEHNQRYTVTTGYPLLLSTDIPDVLKKPYSSFLDKTYRKNVINNRHWPKPPKSGWLGPPDWYSRVGDLVRTTFVVKYLDGVEYLVEAIKQCADEHGYSMNVYFESREEGYYAAHCYVYHSISIPNMDWDTGEKSIGFEIQVTTQLQEVIRKMLHSYYVDRRASGTNEGKGWQWRFRDEEFSTNYLGHILHYLEGQIVEIREKRKNE